jgi:hypothetical protein
MPDKTVCIVLFIIVDPKNNILITIKDRFMIKKMSGVASIGLAEFIFF